MLKQLGLTTVTMGLVFLACSGSPGNNDAGRAPICDRIAASAVSLPQRAQTCSNITVTYNLNATKCATGSGGGTPNPEGASCSSQDNITMHAAFDCFDKLIQCVASSDMQWHSSFQACRQGLSTLSQPCKDSIDLK
jgi:hypothetical protein